MHPFGFQECYVLFMRAWILFILGLTACASSPPAKGPSTDGDATRALSDEPPPKWEGASPSPTATPLAKNFSGALVKQANEPSAVRVDQYDKEETEVVLKRAARQVKNNCGAAKNESGKATGPWGTAVVQVELGHNGHSKGVTVPAPYRGTPVGNCVERAFTNLTFPPWSGSDTQVEWEVELVQPK